MVEGVKTIEKIMQEAPIRRYVRQELSPPSNQRDDAGILEYCRQTASSLYHPTSTARMGTDDMAVVDSNLKVRGISGLRVVDGSIFPTLVSGNTHAAIVMIAEKAADSILGKT